MGWYGNEGHNFLCATSCVSYLLPLCSLMANAKVVGERLMEFQKLYDLSLRHLMETNMEFRTMDKDINTMRPELMKLQWEKEQYMRYNSSCVRIFSLSVHISVCLSICLSLHLSVCPFMSVHLSVCPYVCPSVSYCSF